MSSSSADSTIHVSKKPRIRQDSFDTNLVQVRVGHAKTLFKIHKQLLFNSTPYFKAAFDGNFIEAKEQTLELPEENVVMFKRFQLWLYTNYILEKGEEPTEIDWNTQAELYIFGEMCGIPDLQNAAIDILINKQCKQNAIPTSTFCLVYEKTPEGSSLRRLCVDWMACRAKLRSNHGHAPTLPGASNEWFKEKTRNWYPKDLLFDLVIALSELKDGVKPSITSFKSERAKYHVKSRAATSEPPVNGQK